MGKEYIIELSLPPIETTDLGGTPVMTTAQRNKAAVMIRNECANYDYGNCLPLDCKCPQCNSFSVRCKYFRHVLLKANYIPGARQLESELFGTKPAKICKECGKPFLPGSNRARYCHDCAEKVRRVKKAATMRKQRSRTGNKG